MPTVNKKSKPAIASSKNKMDPMPATAEPIKEEEMDSDPAIADSKSDVEPIEIHYDTDKRQATFSLSSGRKVLLIEPKAADFIYLSSRLETSEKWERSPTMAAYYLAHFMIKGWGDDEPLPTFEDFMDELGDADLGVVGAALSIFPGLRDRITRVFASIQGAK